MKKKLVFGLLLMCSFVFVFGACSSGGGGSKSNGFFRNEIDGKRLDMSVTDTGDNVGINDDNLIHILQGTTASFKAAIITNSEDIIDYDDPELANVIWKISGNIGYFNEEGNVTLNGNIASITVASAGARGTITIELNGFRCTYPVKIVASQSDVPSEHF